MAPCAPHLWLGLSPREQQAQLSQALCWGRLRRSEKRMINSSYVHMLYLLL